jgi:2-keto-4-pentenoate hydratase/2-oxohepta-3-ene-1,7-dioic acid hydratase in catechol pathway
MTTSILRTADAWWAQTPSGAAKIATTATTTGELLADRAAVDAAAHSRYTVPVEGLTLVAPVTAPCRVVAQMTNYASHVSDAGMDPASIPLTFFRKTSGSISGPVDDIVKPAHVRFLDYEVEIGLVIGSGIPVGTEVTDDDLPDYIAGLVVTNDVSARDYRPLQALQALSRFQRLDAGDLVMTGTPAGTALSAPPKPIEIIGNLLPPAVKWKAFFKRQANNSSYLRDGDVVELGVATDDGAIDLGWQRTVVRYA